MKTLLLYLVQGLIASGILYGYYHFFLRNKKFHEYNRYFLLAATVISIAIPFLNIPVYFTRQETEPSALLQTLVVISSGKFDEASMAANTLGQWKDQLTVNNILAAIYLFMALIILSRFIIALIKINRLIRSYPNEKLDEITFINTDEQGTPFSFFHLLFWNRKISLDTADGQQIFRHELFHIRQKHSYDIIFIEILSVIFWFNPFFHLIRKELKTIHEFLADQSAVNKNEEWNYAELLLMQVLGSPNNRLLNPFFHNQIKRRIAMITTSQKTNYQYLRKLLVLPVAAVLIALFAFNYRAKEEAKGMTVLFEKPVTVIIDAGHGGNTGAVAPDGTYEGDITLALAKKVKELNKNDRIRIVLTRDSRGDMDIRKRSEFANGQNPDLFISIHLNNASVDNHPSQKSGFDVFISKKNPAFYSENKILGAILLNYFSDIYPVEKKIQQQNEGIWVLDNSQCPSVLVECGYLSNKEDLAFIKEISNQEKIAQGILQSIEQYAIQKEAPDFNERKKQVADTTMPDIKLIKGANGKVSGTLNGSAIRDVSLVNWTDRNGSLMESIGIVLDNNNISLLSKEQADLLEKKYGSLWNEFIRLHSIPATKKESNGVSEVMDKVFEMVEVDASFPGGEGAWRKYLERNMNVKTGADNKAPDGTYTVWVRFIVDKNGGISDIIALTHHGFGMEDEAMRLISKGPVWVPAMQNGRKVNAYRKQPVTFIVKEENKSTSSAIVLPVENGRKVSVQDDRSLTGATADKTTFINLPGIVTTGHIKTNPYSGRSLGTLMPKQAPFTEPGSTEWREYIEQNLNPFIPMNEGWKAGSYYLPIQFTTDDEGNISDLEAGKNVDSKTAQHCIQLIRNFSKTATNKKKSAASKTTYIQPFIFVIKA